MIGVRFVGKDGVCCTVGVMMIRKNRKYSMVYVRMV